MFTYSSCRVGSAHHSLFSSPNPPSGPHAAGAGRGGNDVGGGLITYGVGGISECSWSLDTLFLNAKAAGI
jgi:hypothetical protein